MQQNQVVEQLIPLIDTAVMMFVNITHKKLIQETILTHRMVVDAIAARDAVGARTAMTMHLTFNRNMIKELYDADRAKMKKDKIQPAGRDTGTTRISFLCKVIRCIFVF